jgi:REP element-mobilizing transposase RayT
MRRTDAWMDEGFGDCVFSSRQISDVLANSLLYFQDVRYVVYCYVVMPNHCHVVVKPLPTFELETILDSWKGFVGHEVNRLLGHSGTLWQDESYDRIVRDEEHLFHIVQYIGRNLEKARIEHELWRRWIHPDWERVGWRFLE